MFTKTKLFLPDNHRATPYIKKIQFLLMFLFQHGQDFTATDVAKYTVQVSDRMYQEGGFFWTREQLNLMKRDPKRVIFTSEFGTGKTTLLKAKIKNLEQEIEKSIKKGPNQSKELKRKIFFILFTAPDSVLTEGIKKEFEANKQIEVKLFSEEGK